jgi:hypothetical protein
VSIEFEWFPKPSELIDPAEPPKSKLGKLSKSSGISIPEALQASGDSRDSEAPQTPYRAIWPEIASVDLAEAAAVQATAAKRARLRARWAQRKYELAQKLGEDDVPRIVAMLRHLDARLKAGEWIGIRWPLHREKSRAISQPWKRAFKAAARLLHLKIKWACDERGKPIVKLYLARNRDVWSLVRIRLTFIESQPPGGSTESDELGFKPLEEIKRERKLFARKIAFQCVLAREDTELKFKGLPAGPKLTKQSQELGRKFADELGPAILLQHIKADLSEDYERLELPRRPRFERPKPTEKPPPPPKEPATGKELALAAKNLIRRQILRQQASW